jgi:myosin heavy subunit
MSIACPSRLATISPKLIAPLTTRMHARTQALLSKVIKVSGSKVRKPRSMVDAGRTRDSICKTMYGRLFDVLVATLNTELMGISGSDGSDAEDRCIGLLDLFGFEAHEKNSFEQLNINYANEKLQQLFIFAIFQVEEEAHTKEGVSWPSIVLPDNKFSIDLISAKPHGILTLLDEASRLDVAKEATFFESVTENNRKSPAFRLAPKKRANEAFGIRHYAGEVIYSGASGGSTSWLDKNTLALEFDVENTLARSPLYDLFSKPTVATRTTTVDGKAEKRTVPRTVCHNFIRDVDQLMETLKAVDTHFIRYGAALRLLTASGSTILLLSRLTAS